MSPEVSCSLQIRMDRRQLTSAFRITVKTQSRLQLTTHLRPEQLGQLIQL